MPLTPSQKSAAFRTRKAERIARMEAALREIIAMSEDNESAKDDEWALGYDAGLENAAMCARNALNPDR